MKNFILVLSLFIFIKGVSQTPLRVKLVKAQGIPFTIPLPNGYKYFEESRFNKMTIDAFKLTYKSTIEINNIELLIPPNYNSEPDIHLYTFSQLAGMGINENYFSELKTSWISGYKNNLYKQIRDVFNADTVFTHIYGAINASQLYYSILINEKTMLSILVIIKSHDETNSPSKIVITNHILKNDNLLLMKFSMNYNKANSLDKIVSTSNWYLSEFNKRNK